MCSTLYIDAEQRIIFQTAQLAEMVGRDNIFWRAEDDRDPPTSEPEDMPGGDLKFCLCPIDVEETMKRAGYSVSFDECFDYIAVKDNLPTDSR